MWGSLRAALGIIGLAVYVIERTSVREVVATTSEGRFMLDIRDRIISWRLILLGNWEPTESAILSSLLRPGDVVLDAGANIGWYSMLFSSRVGANGHVLAFEPEPRNFGLLETNIRLNERSNISAHQIALAESPGELSMVKNSENYGDHHIEASPAKTADVAVVRAAPLDDFTRDFDRIRLLKVDCQGAEPGIVRGATATLAKCDYLAIEFWPTGILRGGEDPQAFLRGLAATFSEFCHLRGTARLNWLPITSLLEDAARLGSGDGKDHTDYLFKR